MKTNVTQTSIAAYHEKQDVILTEKEKVARFAIEETKHARWVWIAKVARHFKMEKSSAGRAMNQLKNEGITLDGKQYEMKEKPKTRDQVTGVTADTWALVLVKQPVGVQTELF